MADVDNFSKGNPPYNKNELKFYNDNSINSPVVTVNIYFYVESIISVVADNDN